MNDSVDILTGAYKIKPSSKVIGTGVRGPANYDDLIDANTATDDEDFRKFAKAVHHAEYNPNRHVSSAGARGPMQLMPDTARSLGVNPDDPEDNIKGGVKELRRLYAKYGGNKILAAAAYNAGDGPVDKSGRVPAYAETIGYTRKIARELGIPWDPTGTGKLAVQAKQLPKNSIEILTGKSEDQLVDQEIQQTKSADPKRVRDQQLFNKLLGVAQDQEYVPGAKPATGPTLATKALTAKSRAAEFRARQAKLLATGVMQPTTAADQVAAESYAREVAQTQARPGLRLMRAAIASFVPYVEGAARLAADAGRHAAPTIPIEATPIFDYIADKLHDVSQAQAQVLLGSSTGPDGRPLVPFEKGMELVGGLAGTLAGMKGPVKAGGSIFGFGISKALEARARGVDDPLLLSKAALQGLLEGAAFHYTGKFIPGQVAGTVAQGIVGGGIAAAGGADAAESIKAGLVQAGLHGSLLAGRGDAATPTANTTTNTPGKLLDPQAQVQEPIADRPGSGGTVSREGVGTVTEPVTAPASSNSSVAGESTALATVATPTRRVANPAIADGQPLEVVADNDNSYTVKLPSGKQIDLPKASAQGLGETTVEVAGGNPAPAPAATTQLALPPINRERNLADYLAQSKVKDAAGNPIAVYHGTQSPTEIKQIDPRKFDPEALYGPGFYTTQDAEVAGGDGGYAATKSALIDSDVVWGSPEYKQAYDSELAKLKARGDYSHRDSADIEGDAMESAYSKASAELRKGTPHAYKLYLDIRNPFDIDAKPTETVLQKLADSDLDVEGALDIPSGGNRLERFRATLTDNEAVYKALSKTLGKAEANNWLVQQGYDGITHLGGLGRDPGRNWGIYDTLEEAQAHASRTGGKITSAADVGLSGRESYSVKGHRVWIAFKPEQVKSATGNIGSFNPSDPRLAYSGVNPFAAISQGIHGLSRLANYSWDKLAPEKVQQFAKAAGQLLAPTSFAPEETKDILFRAKGSAAKAEVKLGELIEGWDKQFAKLKQSVNIDFIDRLKTGTKQVTTDLQNKADFMREFDDQTFLAATQAAALKDPTALRILGSLPDDATRIQFVDKLTQGLPQANPQLDALAAQFPPDVASKLTHYIEDHYRVLWKDKPRWADEDPITGVSRSGRGAGGKRPLQGSRGFQRQHTLADFSDGLISILTGSPATYRTVFEHKGLVQGRDFRVSPSTNPNEVDLLPLSAKGVKELRAYEKDYPMTVVRYGGTPVSYNPVTMFKLAYADVMRYTSAQSMWKSLGDDGQRVFVRDGTPLPDGFQFLNDNIAESFFKAAAPSFPQGVKVHTGRWAVQEDAARMLNNVLRRNLLLDSHNATNDAQYLLAQTGKSLLAIKNAYTAVELGLSPFHAIAESMEVLGSTAGLGIREMVQAAKTGDWQLAKQGAKDSLAALRLVPVKEYKLGRQVFGVIENADQFLATPEGQALEKIYPNIRGIVNDMFVGGSVGRRHQDYRAGFTAAYLDALSQGKNKLYTSLLGGAAAVEQTTNLLFDKAIPYWKAALFLREHALSLEEHADALAKGTVTRGQLARKNWNFVEHRMGELNMDNFYWDNTMKTGVQIGVRSFPWVYGNLAAGANVVPDAVKLMDAMAGKTVDGPVVGQNLAWLAGMSLHTAILGGTMMYLMTGLRPGWDKDKQGNKVWLGWKQAALDSLNPRISEKDPRERVLIPTMWKEYQSLAHYVGEDDYGIPSTFVGHKLAGWLPTLVQDYRNERYDKRPISYEDDPIWRQIGARAAYLMPQPIGPATAYQSYKRTGSIIDALIYGAGVSRAPYFLRQTDAEQLANKYLDEVFSPPGKTRAANERRDTLRELRQQLKVGSDRFAGSVAEALQQGKIREKDVDNLIEGAQKTPLEAAVGNNKITLEHALRIMEASNTEELRLIAPIVMNKLDDADFTELPVTKQQLLVARLLKALKPLKDEEIQDRERTKQQPEQQP